MKRVFVCLSVIALLAATVVAQTAAPKSNHPTAIIETTKGNITCELFPDKAPVTVENFIGLATGTKEWTNPASHVKKHGVPFYDGTIFHRVIPDFMIQGGDPLGDGTGDAGYTIKDEFSDLRFDIPGRLAMANEGRSHTGSSQFFITQVPTPHLNNRHTIFGQCGPISLIGEIARVPRNQTNDKPFQPVKINHIKIINPGATAAAPAKPSATASKPTSKS
jgi:peptidyl-prolyl cis-trans isomerase A (cyclophilin A)